MLPNAVKLTVVLAGTAALSAWIASREPSPTPTSSGEDYCAQAVERMPTAVRTHACLAVRKSPRPGAYVPPWVR